MILFNIFRTHKTRIGGVTTIIVYLILFIYAGYKLNTLFSKLIMNLVFIIGKNSYALSTNV
jgi:hypothetical protein